MQLDGAPYCVHSRNAFGTRSVKGTSMFSARRAVLHSAGLSSFQKCGYLREGSTDHPTLVSRKQQSLPAASSGGGSLQRKITAVRWQFPRSSGCNGDLALLSVVALVRHASSSVSQRSGRGRTAHTPPLYCLSACGAGAHHREGRREAALRG